MVTPISTAFNSRNWGCIVVTVSLKVFCCDHGVIKVLHDCCKGDTAVQSLKKVEFLWHGHRVMITDDVDIQGGTGVTASQI